MVKNHNILIPLWCLSFLISQSTINLSVSIATIAATCGNSNGTIIVIASGGTAPYQYSIDGVNFQSSDTFSNVAPNIYMVSVVDMNNNTGTAIATISNLAGPQILSATASPATCPDNDGGITIAGMGGNGPFTYSVDGATYQGSASFAGLATGNYTATIKDVNGCVSAHRAVAVPLVNDLTVDAGRDTTICEGSSATLNAGSNGTSFSWTPSAGLSDPSSLDPNASPSSTTTYTLTVSWGLCQETGSAIITVNPAPIASAGADTSICSGKSVQLNGSGGGTYAWSPATYLNLPMSADPIVDRPAASTTYHLVVTDQQGCQSLNDAQTTVTVLPPPTLFAGNDTSVLVNQSIPLHAVDVDNSGFTQYAWSPANGLSDPSIQDPIATLEESTTYTVVGSTPAGCQGTASITIKVFSVSNLFVPNAFTPNGDGHNDVLRVIPIGIKEFNYFAVYNRNGQRIFYTADPSVGWDGTLGGVAQMTGVYVWMTGGVDYTNTRIDRKGTVILIR